MEMGIVKDWYFADSIEKNDVHVYGTLIDIEVASYSYQKENNVDRTDYDNMSAIGGSSFMVIRHYSKVDAISSMVTIGNYNKVVVRT